MVEVDSQSLLTLSNKSMILLFKYFVKKFFFLGLILATFSSVAQNNIAPTKPPKIFRKPEQKGILYYQETSVGLKYKTNGWGFFYNKTKIIHATKKKFWEIEFNKIKHEKETKTESIYTQGGPITPKNYYFGKINSLYNIAYRKGYSFVLTEKSIKNGIEVSLNTSAGVNIGFLKPYDLYLVYGDINSNNSQIVAQGYSSSNANYFLNRQTGADIYSYAGFWDGIFKTIPVPGATAKIGLAFDWAAFDDNITSLEVGFTVDAYAVNMPLMAAAKNHQVFPALYASFRIGNKK